MTKTKPTTKDLIILFLPTAAILLHLWEYYYLPNINSYTTTHVYGAFIGFWGVVSVLIALLSLFNQAIYLRWRKQAPFYTLVFLLLMSYDWLTVKTGTLVLPYFPWVDQVFHAILADRTLLIDCTLASLTLLFKGYLLGASLGLVTGILSGYFQSVHYWIAPFMKIIGAIPTTTWLPIVMVLAKTLENAAIFIIALGVWFALNNATYNGVRTIDPQLFEVAQTLGAKQNQLLTKVALPAILPNIFQGLVQGMSTACTALIVAEMVGVESGLGWYITWQKGWASYDKMYAGIVVICLLFLCVNWGIDFLRNHTLKWKESV